MLPPPKKIHMVGTRDSIPKWLRKDIPKEEREAAKKQHDERRAHMDKKYGKMWSSTDYQKEYGPYKPKSGKC